jgi:hypothetical protein
VSGERTPDALATLPSEGVPDAIEPIRAWRVWRASTADVTGHLTLHSLGNGTPWKPREMLEARCSLGAHAAPNAECTCGVYAHKTRKAAIRHARTIGGAVVGEVELWGKVVEHEHGYRAQYARPCALWMPHFPNDVQSRRHALHSYGPVGIYHTRTGRVLGDDDLHRAFVGESLRVLPVKIARWCLLVVAYALLAAFAAVLVLGFGSIIVSVPAGTALAIRDGNLGDVLRMSVVFGPLVFMIVCMWRGYD